MTVVGYSVYENDGVLGPWHANLIEIAETPAILFANDSPIRNFRQNFVVMLSCVLSDLGVEPQIRDRLLVEYDKIGFTSTKSRRVLGSMNDLAFYCDITVSEAGGVHSAKVPSIIRDLNGMPMSMLREGSPDRELQRLVEWI